ncbi:MAG: hypothetical protein NVSMB51_09090 [Solirubrobacteraceae bacterium]
MLTDQIVPSITTPQTARLPALATWAAGVLLLTPLIVLLGLLSILALAAAILLRQVGLGVPFGRRAETALPSTVRLETEPSMGSTGRPAA